MFCCVTNAFAQINVSGAVSGTWSETDLDYYVIDDCYVPGGSTLTILAGVQVKFTGDYDFIVYGGLIVQGVESDSVVFKSLYGTTPGSWTGLEFINILPGVTNLNYCRVEAGDRSMEINDSQVTANNCLFRATSLSPVRAVDSQITLNNCVITQGAGSGVSLQNTDATITGCTITYNTGSNGHGINANTGGNLTVVGGYIGQNIGNGINALSIDDIVLTQVELENNDGYGVELSFCTELNAYRCLIHNNGDHGIFVSSTPMQASNLTVSTNGGIGVSIANADLILSSSIVDRNAEYGIHCQNAGDYLSYNCLFENTQGNYSNCSAGLGSIEEDPQYVSWGNRDYNLTEDSPCIDAGSPFDPNDPDGTVTDMGAIYFNQDPVDPLPNIIPGQSFQIASTYPNPFNPTLTIMLEAAKPLTAKLQVWSLDGRLVDNVWEGWLMPGRREITWRATGLASGRYYLRLESENEITTKSVLLLK